MVVVLTSLFDCKKGVFRHPVSRKVFPLPWTLAEEETACASTLKLCFSHPEYLLWTAKEPAGFLDSGIFMTQFSSLWWSGLLKSTQWNLPIICQQNEQHWCQRSSLDTNYRPCVFSKSRHTPCGGARRSGILCFVGFRALILTSTSVAAPLPSMR